MPSFVKTDSWNAGWCVNPAQAVIPFLPIRSQWRAVATIAAGKGIRRAADGLERCDCCIASCSRATGAEPGNVEKIAASRRS